MATGRTPVTSAVRFTRAVATAPAVAFRKPESVPMVSELPTMKFVVEAVPFESIWNVEVADKTPPFAA